jgi:hypothetical protein
MKGSPVLVQRQDRLLLGFTLLLCELWMEPRWRSPNPRPHGRTLFRRPGFSWLLVCVCVRSRVEQFRFPRHHLLNQVANFGTIQLLTERSLQEVTEVLLNKPSSDLRHRSRSFQSGCSKNSDGSMWAERQHT